MTRLNRIRRSCIALIVVLTLLAGVIAPASVVYADDNNNPMISMSYKDIVDGELIIDIFTSNISNMGALTFDIDYDESLLEFKEYKVDSGYPRGLISVNDDGSKLRVGMISDSGITIEQFYHMMQLTFKVNYQGSKSVIFRNTVVECKDTMLNDTGLSFINNEESYQIENSLNTSYEFVLTGSEQYKMNMPGKISLSLYKNAGIYSGSCTINYPKDKVRFDKAVAADGVEAINVSYNDTKEGTVNIAYVLSKPYKNTSAFINIYVVPLVKNESIYLSANNISITNEKYEEYALDKEIVTCINVGEEDGENVFSLNAPAVVDKNGEFTVDVYLTGNTGFGSLTASIKYDSEAMEYVGANVDSETLNGTLSSIAKTSDGTVKLGVISATDFTKSGKLASITFRAGNKSLRSIINLNIDDFTDSLAKKMASVASGVQVSIEGDCKHDWNEGEIVTESTCTKAGKIKYTCKKCDESYEDTIKATGHSFADEYTTDKEATCTRNGSKSRHCKNCDARAEIKVIEALGHEFDTGKIIKKPTYQTKGVKRHTCTRCGFAYNKNTSYLSIQKPSNVKAAVADKSVKLSWNKVAGATGYIVYRIEGKKPLTKVATISRADVCKYIDTKVSSGKAYTYYVKAYNKVQLSGYSTKAATIYLAKTAKVSVSNTSKGTKVKWSKVAGAKGYYIYKKTEKGKYTKIATVKKGTTVTYIDKKVKNGSKYTYRIVAFSGKTLSAGKESGVILRLDRVSVKKLSKVKKAVNVKISANKKAAGYQIQYSTSSKFKSAKVINIKSSKEPSVDIKKGLKKGKTYYVRVRAVKKIGKVTYTSEWSAGKKIKY